MASARLAQEKMCKVVLTGESGTGKTSLALQFVSGQFTLGQPSTVGVMFLTKSIRINDTVVKLDIWDTAGQERFKALTPMYYIYIRDQDSFQRSKIWVKELQRQAPSNIVIALVGNKAGLSKNRAIEFIEAQEYAEENDLIFMETSAKYAMNVNEIFFAIVNKCLKNEDAANQEERKDQTIKLKSKPKRKALKKCCK